MNDGIIRRKLLYHRHIDDEPGTYITDYFQCAVCVVCCIYLALCVLRNKRTSRLGRGDGSYCNVTKTTYCTILFLISYFCLSLCAGLSHQFLQTVEPHNSLWTWTDDPTWLIVWRLGFALSSGVAFALLILPKLILDQEDICHIRGKASCLYYAIVGAVSLGIVVYNVAISFHHKDPWQSLLIFATLFACTIVNFVAMLSVLYILWRRNRRSVLIMENSSPTSCSEALVYPTKGSRRSDPKTISLFAQDEKGSDEMTEQTDGEPAVRCDLVLRAVAPFVFVTAGLIWFLLAQYGCADHNDPAAHGCPLPNTFNHNAVMHTIHAFTVALFFAAEYCALWRQNRDEDEDNRTRASTGSTAML